METVRNIPLMIQLVNFTRYNSNSDRMLKISVPNDQSGACNIYAEDEDEHYNSNSNSKRTAQV